MTHAPRILVVGGAGYIGSHVVHELLAAGYQVVVFDNLSTGDAQNLPSDVPLVCGDLRHGDELMTALTTGIDVVFHFAARKAAGESMQLPHVYAEDNIAATLRLLRLMATSGVNRLVFSSSAAVYGSPAYLPVDEAHPCNPENYYGYTKLVIEENLAWFSRLADLRYVSLRYFNATGYDLAGRVTAREKDPANLCPVVMEVASGMRQTMKVFGGDYDTRDGTCIRDYIHVNDLADAHIAAMQRLLEVPQSMAINLGAERGSTVLEMIQAAHRVTGRKISYEIVDRRSGDPAELVASSALAHTTLDWRARHSGLETIFESMCSPYGL